MVKQGTRAASPFPTRLRGSRTCGRTASRRRRRRIARLAIILDQERNLADTAKHSVANRQPLAGPAIPRTDTGAHAARITNRCVGRVDKAAAHICRVTLRVGHIVCCRGGSLIVDELPIKVPIGGIARQSRLASDPANVALSQPHDPELVRPLPQRLTLDNRVGKALARRVHNQMMRCRTRRWYVEVTDRVVAPTIHGIMCEHNDLACIVRQVIHAVIDEVVSDPVRPTQRDADNAAVHGDRTLSRRRELTTLHSNSSHWSDVVRLVQVAQIAVCDGCLIQRPAVAILGAVHQGVVRVVWIRILDRTSSRSNAQGIAICVVAQAEDVTQLMYECGFSYDGRFILDLSEGFAVASKRLPRRRVLVARDLPVAGTVIRTVALADDYMHAAQAVALCKIALHVQIKCIESETGQLGVPFGDRFA